MPSSKTDAQIKRLEKIVEEKQEELQKETYDQYIGLFNIALKFLKKEKIIMYGGTAINSILPKADKFYEETELPDLDMFAIHAKDVAFRLLKEYNHKGYDIATVREALHEGTWKVKVNGVDIADITEISKESFDKIKHKSVVGDLGLRVANTDYLRMTLYYMISQPIDSHRWVKVLQRLSIMNRTHPFIKPKSIKVHKTKKHEKPKEEIKNIVHDALKKLPYVLIYDPEIMNEICYATKRRLKEIPGQTFVLVDGNPREHAATLIKVLSADNKALKFKIGAEYPSDDFIPDNVTIVTGDGDGDTLPVATLFSTNSTCLSYNDYNNVRVASIPTMIRLFYSLYFSDLKDKFGFSTNDIRAILYILINAQENTNGNAKMPSLLEQFVTKCYGTQAKIFTLRRNQFARIIEKKAKK